MPKALSVRIVHPRAGGALAAFMLIENDNLTCLCFNYTLSTKEVQIIGTNAIPEFPSFIILLVFVLATVAVVTLSRKESEIFQRIEKKRDVW